MRVSGSVMAVATLIWGCSGGSTEAPDAGPDTEIDVTIDADVQVDEGGGGDPMADPMGDPMDEPDGSCAPVGLTRTTPCGPCAGVQSQICTTLGTWADDGVCVGGGDCAPGSVETRSGCGASTCGTETRICGASCLWNSWGSCVEPSVVECSTPGVVEVTRAGCPEGSLQQRECSASCAYVVLRPCSTECVGAPTGVGTYDEEVCVEGGPFYQGGADGTSTDDDPEHVVVLAPFFVQRWKTTNLAYRACVTAGGCTPPASPSPYYLTQDLFPFDSGTWSQAAAFCAWQGKRLPTESEWEKAGRGPFPLRSRYSWGDATPTCAEAMVLGCGSNMGNVDAFPGGASPFGVERENDGASEFVEDWWSATYYSASPTFDPRGPATGPWRTTRGTGWGFPPASLPAITMRYGEAMTSGIRCARSVEAR